MFSMFFGLGLEHIIDLNGYDHILFLVAISIIYLLKDYKKVLILVTAFTIGHSLTLVLAVLDIINVSSSLIEFLIPVTIFISAFVHFFYKDKEISRRMSLFAYFSALFFGLIHGLGFSNYLKVMLGAEQDIVLPLFAFNLGLEVGQIIIVLAILVISTIFINYIKTPRRDYVLISSGAIAGISLIMMLERFSF